jgi:hypothetical protein
MVQDVEANVRTLANLPNQDVGAEGVRLLKSGKHSPA